MAAGEWLPKAWSSYGVEWPVIYHFLGVRPHIPNGEVTVIPELPTAWPALSIDHLRVGNDTMAVAATHDGNRYTTSVTSPSGLRIRIGYALPTNSTVTAVTLNGSPAAYEVRGTHRGREVIVAANSGQPLQFVVNTQ